VAARRKEAKENEKEVPEQAPPSLLLARKENFKKAQRLAKKEREQGACS
jgi:hypothetical protein